MPSNQDDGAAPNGGDDPEQTNAGGGNRNRKRCSVSGCDKQSQGGRNNQMCRFHFKEWAAQNPDLAKEIHQKALVAASMVGLGAEGGRMKVDGGGQRRTLCKIDGCPKQSQGGRCNNMCAAHYNEAIKSNPSNGDMLPSLGTDGTLSVSTADKLPMSTVVDAAPTTSASGAKRKSPHPSCSIETCSKQSQGARCNQMCARHYKEFGGGGNNEGNRGPAPVASDRPRKVRRNPNGGHHPLCMVDGCPKLSQGGRCNHMCASHHKEHLTVTNPRSVGV